MATRRISRALRFVHLIGRGLVRVGEVVVEEVELIQEEPEPVVPVEVPEYIVRMQKAKKATFIALAQEILRNSAYMDDADMLVRLHLYDLVANTFGGVVEAVHIHRSGTTARGAKIIIGGFASQVIEIPSVEIDMNRHRL